MAVNPNLIQQAAALSGATPTKSSSSLGDMLSVLGTGIGQIASNQALNVDPLIASQKAQREKTEKERRRQQMLVQYLDHVMQGPNLVAAQQAAEAKKELTALDQQAGQSGGVEPAPGYLPQRERIVNKGRTAASNIGQQAPLTTKDLQTLSMIDDYESKVKYIMSKTAPTKYESKVVGDNIIFFDPANINDRSVVQVDNGKQVREISDAEHQRLFGMPKQDGQVVWKKPDGSYAHEDIIGKVTTQILTEGEKTIERTIGGEVSKFITGATDAQKTLEAYRSMEPALEAYYKAGGTEGWAAPYVNTLKSAANVLGMQFDSQKPAEFIDALTNEQALSRMSELRPASDKDVEFAKSLDPALAKSKSGNEAILFYRIEQAKRRVELRGKVLDWRKAGLTPDETLVEIDRDIAANPITKQVDSKEEADRLIAAGETGLFWTRLPNGKVVWKMAK